MKKIYIFFTYYLLSIGGTQLYTAGKATYLQRRGWQVYVFFAGPDEGVSVIPSLTQFIKSGGGMHFLQTPPYKLSEDEQNYCLQEMGRRLDIPNPEECEIIIESHDDTQAYWAELLAALLKARHFFITCDESYRSTPAYPDKTYEYNLDFFYFKWRRNELVGQNISLQKLFNGYKNVTEPLCEMPPTIREQDAVQNVDFRIENVARLDWNICHIGRAQKSYVPHFLEGVAELARRHPDKRINLILVGDVTAIMNLLQRTFNNCPNVLLTSFGDMVPIPRVLFSKVDVVCAISQSAIFAANEDVLTICASVDEEKRTPGVLGYDTEKTVNGAGTFSYVEALENVLVKKIYAGKKSTLPKLRPAEEYYDDFWKIVKNAAPVKEYYILPLVKGRRRRWTAIFPFGLVARGARIILFRANEIAWDYRRQIYSQSDLPVEFGRDYVKHLKPQPYCEIVAVVDEHPENFDNSVFGMERLLERDYDVIVICAVTNDVQAAFNKIIAVVPDMSERIINNFKVLTM